jgi:hypothetical protein
MNLKKRALGALAGVLAFATLGGVATAADLPYTEGTVSVVNSFRTEPGMFNAYMAYLKDTYKPMMEDAKKAGHVLDYAVYSTSPRSPDDPNVYIVVTYKNMAALDGLTDRMDAIQAKYVGDQAKRDAAAADREKMRTMIGTEMLRELVLK